MYKMLAPILNLFVGSIGGVIIGCNYKNGWGARVTNNNYLRNLYSFQAISRVLVHVSVDPDYIFNEIGKSFAAKVNGALVGFSLVALDEIMIYNKNYIKDYLQVDYNKHYLSMNSFWYIMSSPVAAGIKLLPLPSSDYILTSGKLLSAGIISHYTDDFLDNSIRVELITDSFNTMMGYFDDKKILNAQELEKFKSELISLNFKEAYNTLIKDYEIISNNPFLSSYFTSSLMDLTYIILSIAINLKLSHYATSSVLENILSESNKDNKKIDFKNDIVIKGAKIIAMKAIDKLFKIVAAFIINPYFEEQQNLISKKAYDLVISEDNGKKLKYAPQGEHLAANIESDLQTLYSTADLVSLIRPFSSSIVALKNLMDHAPQMLIYEVALTYINQKLTKFLSELSKGIQKDLDETQNDLNKHKSHLMANINEIINRDGKEFFQHKVSIHNNDINELKSKMKFYREIKPIIKAIIEYSITFKDVLLYGYQFSMNKLDIPKINLAVDAVNQMSEFISSNVIFEADSIDLLLARERIVNFTKIIEGGDNQGLTKTFNNDNKIIYKNFTLSLPDRQLVHIEYLEFETGKTYAITGRSGDGKTSIMLASKEKLYGILKASGEISMYLVDNHPPKIILLNQKEYLPTDLKLNLLELIYFPNVLPQDNAELIKLKNQVIKILGDFQISGFSNDHTEQQMYDKLNSTDYKLSGGEQSRVLFASAIFSNPDILLIDESFGKLNHDLKKLSQKTLREYLPDATIIVITHEEVISTFYDLRYNFKNGGIEIYNTPCINYDAEVPTIGNVNTTEI
jgi:ABC-type lipoprotein export system ATPase subunit